MLLEFVLALLEGAGEPEGYVLLAQGKTCDNKGVCEACKSVSLRYPYWDGEKCVSCRVGVSQTFPYLDLENEECEISCWKGYPDDNNVCRSCSED